MRDIQDFDSLMIKLASPETIRAWSYGEVKKPETINYRTLRPEKEGLFCERIFGTTKEWECYCGKFKSVRYKGVICDRCGVEVTHFKVRRERMGHIELATPVSHIWYYRNVPSRMGLLLDLQVAQLRSVLYYEKYIVIDPGDTDLKKNSLLTEEEYLAAQERYGGSFSAGMGAEAIKTLLENLNLDDLAAELRKKMRDKDAKPDKRLLRRIEIVENFRASSNKCSWMILDVIPVIPPDLRPMVQLDGGRFATSDLNDLYRRVINRNNRLKRLMSLSAPDIIIRNEKRMLQEAVDSLFDNSKRKRVVKGASNRPLKSISDMLKGKQGRFRQNLLGKRVDYSGRSVIVVGPELKLWQCGLPTKMALELFKPFIIKKLIEKNHVQTIKRAKTMVDSEDPFVFAILDEVVREHPVLLNRAPTLHRLSIQAFEPVLVEGKAIKLHPLVCHAFNADFDGDQMAVHVPLTQTAQMECWTLMLSARNLLDPANGKTIVYPSQDMVLGIYYLTKIKPVRDSDGNIVENIKRYSSMDEVILAAENNVLGWQTEIRVPAIKDSIDGSFKKGDIIRTTAGRLVFNDEMPKEVKFINSLLGDKELKKFIETVLKEQGSWMTVKLVDAIKAVGYKYATFFGATISMDDIIIPEEKVGIMAKANGKVAEIENQLVLGSITDNERYQKICAIWRDTNDELTKVMLEKLANDKDGFNTIHMMATSGARGSSKQISQLAGMRGLMAKPNGDIIEMPIRANFKEGLSVIEFFISTSGARKGLSDTALKTAQAGYLTRRLVDVAQDVVINEEDCGTINGIEYTAIKEGDEVKVPLKDRIVGLFTLERVIHPITHEIICGVNEYVTDELAQKIDDAGVESVKMRTVLTCESRHGVCCKCYGRDLAHNKIIEIGEAVGIIAAQSIGQPGTQLTMRTFHTGGIATSVEKEDKIKLNYPVIIESLSGPHVEMKDGSWLFTRKGKMIVNHVIDSLDIPANAELLVASKDRILKGTPLYTSKGKEVLASDNAIIKIANDGKKLYLLGKETKIDIKNGYQVVVKVGDYVGVDKNDVIAKFDPYSEPFIAEADGYVHYEDIIPGSTMEEKFLENGNIERTITKTHLDTKEPRILITDEAGSELRSYNLPAGSIINVDDNQKISSGTIIAKIAKEAAKTNDITSGLPRISELFEAQSPKNPAVLAQVTGEVQFKGKAKGKHNIIVVDKYGKTYKHEVPLTKRLLVRDGDSVEVAEPLCDGAINPKDILAISGENTLQNYLLLEIQKVYSGQGININDKHIGVILRQMLRKVEIAEVGDTSFILGQQVYKYKFHEENRRIIAEGGQPAIARPMFQGIKKAASTVDSFISAASFQETTKVLTNAAIAGQTDGLRGLKENVVIGHMIPAGTGIRNYKNVKLFDDNETDLDVQMNQILEERKLEKEQQQEILRDDPSFDQDED